MKVSEVGDKDCQVLAAFMQRLRVFRVPDTMMLAEVPELSDGLRWLQSLAVEMAKARAESLPSQAAAAAAAPAETMVVKEYHPGGKKK